MIKLNNINKFYNKGKLNQIHVINNTNLVLEEKGLVAITGPSGCGKTTLLNIIGGLDKFESGTIDFDGEHITRYSPNRWDVIRNKYVGYIFQNYNLIPDKTVFENIQITLHMAGLYDKKEVEERIHYVLRAVGLYNYRRRNVLALSGGQQQRVAIARALAKNPKVILADEPTGNLDATNTYEIMRLIKKISKSCLVILVSHERELVSFYADRIVELLDGSIIKDYENSGNKVLARLDDRKIYLKDLMKETQDGLAEVQSYYQEKPAFAPEIKLIHLNQTLYVKVNADTRIKYITDESDVHLIDDHYKEEVKDDVDRHSFDMSQFGYIAMHAKRKSFIRFRDTLLQGFLKIVGGQRFIGKLFILVFFVISMIVVNNLATFANLTKVDEKMFVDMPRNAVGIAIDSSVDLDKLLALQNHDIKPYISVYPRGVNLSISYQDLYQGSGLYRGAIARVTAYPVPLSYVSNYSLFLGRLPENNQEMVIDRWIADRILESKAVADIGITSYNEVLEGKLMSLYREYGNLQVVGIIETESPIVAVTDDNIYYFAPTEVGAMGSIRNIPTLVEGVWAVSDNEILVNKNTDYQLGDRVLHYGKAFTVVGIFENANYVFILSNEMYQDTAIRGLFTSQLGYDLLILTDNKHQLVLEMEREMLEGRDLYEEVYTNYVNNQRIAIAGRINNIILTLGGIIVYIYLMIRSSMLNRIKEIGIYRSIGATKQDIYKIFVSEILAFTTIGGLTGYLTMSYLIHQIQKAIDTLFSIYYFPFYMFIGGIVGIYVINIIFGMIPIFMLLRKTPAEIMAKYDI